MKKINIKDAFNLVTLILVLVVGGAAFFGGVKYQQMAAVKAAKSQYATNPFSGRNQFGNRNGTTENTTNTQNGIGERRMGNGQVFGEITNVSDNSITVKGNDGNSRIIILSDKTTISKASSGQISDLKVGEKVSVFGTPNTDGSVSGTNIQLNLATPQISGTPSGTPQK